MIPAMNITAWSRFAPWAEQRQVEQDLIISRAIVELFSDELLSEELRFRGGTALNKLHFPAALRYSEDIDLVRSTKGPIKGILGRIRDVLEPWLGQARFEQSPVAPKLIFRAEAEGGGAAPLRLKVEIATRETTTHDDPLVLGYAVSNDWFSGKAAIPTYSREEMLATKLRALLQRNKSRDLFDLSHGLTVFEDLDLDRVISLFQRYLEEGGQRITRAQAEERMFSKLANPGFLADIRPLLTPAEADGLTEDKIKEAFWAVFTALVGQIPGEPWARTSEMIVRFDLQKR
jgi:predicted nucleotidyltransferase component of viral defense system